jgi:hypothetical protein
VSSGKTGSEVSAGLSADERPLRKEFPNARVGGPTSIGSAELMPPRSIPVTAITGFCALPKWKEQTSAQLVPARCPRSSGSVCPTALGRHRCGTTAFARTFPRSPFLTPERTYEDWSRACTHKRVADREARSTTDHLRPEAAPAESSGRSLEAGEALAGPAMRLA